MVTKAHPWVLPNILSFYALPLSTIVNIGLTNGIYCQDLFIAYNVYQAYQMKLQQKTMDKQVELYKHTLLHRQAVKEKNKGVKKVVGIKIVRPLSESMYHTDLISTIWLGVIPFQYPLVNKKLQLPKERINRRRHFVLQFKNDKGEWVKLSNFVLVDFYIYTMSTFNQIDAQRSQLKTMALEHKFVVIRVCKRDDDTFCPENTFSSQVLIDIANRKASFLVNVGSKSYPYGLSHTTNDIVNLCPNGEPPDKSVIDDMVKIYVPLVNRDILTPMRKDQSYLPLENVITDVQYPPMIIFSTAIVILANTIARKMGCVK